MRVRIFVREGLSLRITAGAARAERAEVLVERVGPLGSLGDEDDGGADGQVVERERERGGSRTRERVD